ncbi:hypothetical protein TWF718_003459 [Orbilia javanica]|uniref:Uncharacterized protein n=1 Tax=Orbilia javanica TaxID=47235 RepID=A0AAN8MEP2_9PEZI
MDSEGYIPVSNHDDETIADKDLDPPPTTPPPHQPHPYLSPPDYPLPLPPAAHPYTPTETKHLLTTTLLQSLSLTLCLISTFLGIHNTPTEEDYDPNEHGSTSAFRLQLLNFRITLLGLIPAFLIYLVKTFWLPRVLERRRTCEESRRLADDIDGEYNPYASPYAPSSSPADREVERTVAFWWRMHLLLERSMVFALYVFAVVVSIWLAVGKFRGYIRPRGPFDDAICAFSDPRVMGGDLEITP